MDMPWVNLEECRARFNLGEVLYFPRLGSTNDLALDMLSQGCAHRTLIIADEQTAGRGRQGRKWFTLAGSALALSLVIKDLPPWQESALNVGDLLGRYTALGAVGVCQALNQNYQLEARIKWPNDVLIHDKKVGGILAEAQWQGEQVLGVVLGVGLNIQPPSVPDESELRYPATCIERELGKPVRRSEVLFATLSAIFAWHERLLLPEFIQKWEELLAFRQEWIEILIGPEKQPTSIQVQILGLDDRGYLKVRTADQREWMLAQGEIHLCVRK